MSENIKIDESQAYEDDADDSYYCELCGNDYDDEGFCDACDADEDS